ncbi:Transcriptional activator protein acu-15 [Pseudocercospora fuligena]|uniref:Transcriptional activator protein acu-15 n=1 Tax=Pseudocercospora fuligena TaxID=685502 RepID=A0A8H6VH07_9PEZI|nr:Transcriptional activator protein acu-15 [Pseudocercospora fuligena]
MPSSTKRLGDGDGSGDNDNGINTPQAKIPRTDGNAHPQGNGDFSGSVKKKIAGSTRTGQACDRCKIRKIRCDARPGGCSPCLQNNTECKTTDRITGRATSRGHTEHIENENAQLKMYMVELQQQLREAGVEPKQPPPAPAYMAGGNQAAYWQQAQSWGNMYSGSSTTSSVQGRDRSSPQSSLLPDFRAGCIGDNYLGVSSENNWLSPIEGTSLALFGTKIDLAEFMPSDSDPTASAMSYRTFLGHAFRSEYPQRPDLPAYEQCKVYADWYFRSIQQFIPLLHKPDFMNLLDKIHHQNYQPKPAEAAMVHMVLAVINFQFSSRNANDQAREDSMNHYHYACSFIPDLITGHTLEDIQALALICSQLRNQPRPGAAWMFTNLVMGLAIESGLHRSAKAWQNSALDQDPHHLEMRKRIFWSILLFHVHISGKLGRPMPLRMEDFDIEMPEAKPDNLPGEPTGKWKNCSFRAGIEGFKLLKIMMQVYSTIYSIRSTGQYEMNVRQLEKDLETFHQQVPAELRGGPQSQEEDRISALYLDMSVAECQLLLHHPSLCRTASPQLMNQNLDTCLLWSGKLLESATQLKTLKSLDTTWYYSTDFLAAIFTTLFAYTERRDQMTSQDLQRLRQDMDSWIDVMAEVSNLLGATPQLVGAIRGIVEFSLGNIQRHLAAKTASAAVASASSPTTSDHQQAQQLYNATNGYSTEYTAQNGDVNQGQAYAQDQSQNNYPPQSFAYAHAHPPAQNSNGIYNTFDGSGYSGEEAKPNIEAELVASMAQQQAQQPAPTNFMAAFQSPNPQVSNGFQQSPQTATMNSVQAYPQAGPAAWRHFADSMMTNVAGDYNLPAGALMSLTGKSDGSGDMTGMTMGNIPLPTGDANGQPWPLIHYNSSGEPTQQ